METTENCVICLDEKSISELNLYTGACSSCNHKYNARMPKYKLDEVLKQLKQREDENETESEKIK